VSCHHHHRRRPEQRTFDDLQRTLRDTCHMLRTDKPGRMPMAYMHIVHVMVDSLLLVSYGVHGTVQQHTSKHYILFYTTSSTFRQSAN
jgi:hypothetical protein